MSAFEGSESGNADGPLPNPATSGPRRRGWSPVRILVTIVVIVVVVVGLAGAAIFVAIRNSFNRPPAAVQAPIAWKSGQVVLSAEQPIADGHFNVIAGAVSPQNTLAGLNVGLPLVNVSGSFPPSVSVPASTVDPAALISIPSVRLSTTGQAGAQSCLAPCELIVGSGFNCVTGTCRLDVDFKLELIGESVASLNSVTIEVSGAIRSTGLSLPGGLQLEFELDEGPSGS